MKAYCCYCCDKKLSGWTGGISGEGKEEGESGHAEDTGKQREERCKMGERKYHIIERRLI